MNKRKLDIIKERVVNRMTSFSKDVPKFSSRKIVSLVLVLIFIVSLGYLSISLFKDLKELNSVKDEMIITGSDIQLGYHRVFNLADGMDLVDHTEFKKDCEEFSFDCLYEGDVLRGELLKGIKNRSFSDRDIEILNMVSSVEIGTKEKIEQYNNLLDEYTQIKERFPLKVIQWLLEDLKGLS